MSSGMPELKEEEDIMYLRNRLALQLTDEQAKDLFIKEIHGSLKDFFRLIDNLIHDIRHG